MKKIISAASKVTMWGGLVLVFAVLAFAAPAYATIIVDENFDRADGDLVGTIPTPGPGAAWANHSGSTNFIQLSSGQAVVQHGSGSLEDANTSFSLYSSGVLTAVFDINVSASTNISGTDTEYFAHFKDGGTGFRARLDVVPANIAGGDYTLGIAASGGSPQAVFPTDFSFGSTVNVSLAYDLDTGMASLTVGSTTIQDTNLGSLLPMSAFALRQSTSSINETIRVDNLVVSYIPEPSTFVLAGLGGLIALLRRRR